MTDVFDRGQQKHLMKVLYVERVGMKEGRMTNWTLYGVLSWRSNKSGCIFPSTARSMDFRKRFPGSTSCEMLILSRISDSETSNEETDERTTVAIGIVVTPPLQRGCVDQPATVIHPPSPV